MFKLFTGIKIQLLAITRGYIRDKYIGRWKEYKVYNPISLNQIEGYIVIPDSILVDKKRTCSLEISHRSTRSVIY